MTLRAAGRRAAAAAAPVAAAAAPTAALVLTTLRTFAFLERVFAALRAPAARPAEARDFVLRLFVEARFFEAFLLEARRDGLLDRLLDRLVDRLLDDRLPVERFFEDDFFEEREDFREEPFLEAAIWFLLLTRLDLGVASDQVARESSGHGNSVARKTI
jgi:hypothetical protein